MKLIKDLGPRERKTSTRKDRWGLFECSICKKHGEYPLTNGKKGVMCIDCRRVLSATKHSMCTTTQYHSWSGMKQRCNNKKLPNYYRYGGRGIKYADKWEKFEGFWEDMKDNHFENATIDRIDNDLGYCKENCQWLTMDDNREKDKTRPVIQYKVEGKNKVYAEQLKIWPSMKEAAFELNLLQSKIGKVCQNKGFTHGGYGWNYVNHKL